MTTEIAGRSILLTGGGGSIGSALAKTITALHPRALIVLDNSERNLFEVDAALTSIGNVTCHTSILGDVCDSALLSEILAQFLPEIIFHVAAFKHVPLAERNPIAAVRNNALGTNLLAIAARERGVEKLVMVSTDKAVNPSSVMGASKRVGELSLHRWGNSRTQMTAIRLGNVLDSEGSVAPTFARQISAGGPVTVTHPDVNRYFLTMDAAVELILLAAELRPQAGVFVPSLGEPVRILDLAHQKIKEAGLTPGDIPITFTGLRPGDKMCEEFTYVDELLSSTSDSRLLRVMSGQILASRFDVEMERLADGVERRDLAATMDALCDIVPGYRLSESIMRLLAHSSAGIQ